jgi:hypothetical protein
LINRRSFKYRRRVRRRILSFWRRLLTGEHWADETIPATRERLNKPGILWIVPQGVSNLPNGSVDAVLGVYEDFAGPEAPGDFCAGDELALARDQQDK